MNNLQQGKRIVSLHSIIIIIMQKYIETPRLILRDWKEEDIPFFARMNADPNVMEFFLIHCHRKNHLPFISVFKMSSKPVASVCML